MADRGAQRRASREACLKPVLDAMLQQFPFRIRGFHSDNGSEFINQTVAELLQQAADRADQKPAPAERRQRPGRDQERRGDPQAHRLRLHPCRPRRAHQGLLREYLNPYLNYHRPCAQAEVEVDEQGRKRAFTGVTRRPGDLLALPEPKPYLREGLSIATLKRIAAAISDTEAAQRMQQAKRKLFGHLRPSAQRRWK